MDRFLCYALVFFGGGAGALLRHVTNLEGSHPFMPGNILACFLIGITYATARYRIFTSKYFTSFTTLGFLGGLSTFTPLALFSVALEQDSVLFSSITLCGFMLAFFAIAVIGYSLAALFFVRVMHRQPMPSVAAAFRAYRHNRARKRHEDAKETKTSLRLREILAIQKALKKQREAETAAKAKAEAEMLQAEAADLEAKAEELAEAHKAAHKIAEESYQKAYKQALEEKLAALKKAHRADILGFKNESEGGSQPHHSS